MPLDRRAVFMSSLVVGVSLAACGQGESAKPSGGGPALVAGPPPAAAPVPVAGPPRDAGSSLDAAVGGGPDEATASPPSVAVGGMRNARITLPRFRLGSPTLVGTYPKNQLRRFLKRATPQLRYCYERQLLATPGLAGTMTVDFVIGKAGDVRRVKATGFDRAVDRCVEETIEAIAFPAPDAGIVEVSYPLEFAPSGG